jgi:hypothetical protein
MSSQPETSLDMSPLSWVALAVALAAPAIFCALMLCTLR